MFNAGYAKGQQSMMSTIQNFLFILSLSFVLAANCSSLRTTSKNTRLRGRSLKQLKIAGFPFKKCDQTQTSWVQPWNARLLYQLDIGGSTLVAINLWTNKSCTHTLGQLRIGGFVKSGYVAPPASFTDAYISHGNVTTNYSDIGWRTGDPVVIFRNLDFKCKTGQAYGGYLLTFTITQGSMSMLCQNKGCPFAVVHNQSCSLGNLGYVPVIVNEGPSFDQG
ncbi:hypothetical protein CEUSTIGMA_g1107.t1 [Chlamydomonas eustigma]|uniref:Pherophorin domain-containing protein n=1 Tax=Chlamydomonas eustigma TaxID=1157962 RepID=A0A250WSF2_9CHLO|nr:hypothetical protein CEUSTIGMA_g1107.t1 [Chlamydomonas eustigma]|eukprot:GAX73656.1 hypothetical protein CEUSTIGMA_g1107.t1 [Chlamydomonas eustigma]